MKFLIDLAASKKSDKKYFSNFHRFALRIFKCLHFQSAALSILLVRDKKMAALNWKLMQHKGSTDVLSFSYLEKKGKVRRTSRVLAAQPPAFLGEIIVCLDTAKRNSKEYKTSFEYECALYLCHGILHCLGYDDRTKKGYSEMQRKQEKILKTVFLSSVVSRQSLVGS